MPRVFISYRRDDSAASAGRLYDRLRERFGVEHVFRDVDIIAPGAEFASVIAERIGQCDALIAVIGRDWLVAKDSDGKHRLDNPDDFVKTEIREALDCKKLVIPALVEGAHMPKAAELPADIASLAERNAIEISESRFDFDVERLMAAIPDGDRAQSVKDPTRPMRIWRWISDESSQRTLRFVGAGVAAVVAALWTGYIHFSGLPPADVREIARAELARLHMDYGPLVFIQAAGEGNLPAVRLFIQAGMDPNVKDRGGDTALMYAAGKGHTAVVDALLRAKANVNEENRARGTAVSWAAASGQEGALRSLLASGPTVDAIDQGFIAAAKYGQRDLLPILLERLSDKKKVMAEALNQATSRQAQDTQTERGLAKVVRFLVGLGADVNTQAEDGFSPLMNAALRGHLEIVQILLDTHAAINTKCVCLGWSGGGFAALMMASGAGHADVVDVLLTQGADPDIKSNNGTTALIRAAEESNNMPIIRALLDKGADVNARNDKGETALIKAVYRDDVAQLLLERGADANAKDNNGVTVLMWAIRAHHVELVHALLERGANVNAKNENGISALMYAADEIWDEIVQILLQRGARVNEKDANGKTALQYAQAVDGDAKMKTVRLIKLAGGK